MVRLHDDFTMHSKVVWDVISTKPHYLLLNAETEGFVFWGAGGKHQFTKEVRKLNTT